MSTRVPDSIELKVVKKERRDTKSSTDTGRSSATDTTVVPNKKRSPKKHKTDKPDDTPSCSDKVAAWACAWPIWITCFFTLLTYYANWNLEGGHKVVLAKVAVSQILTGLAGAGGTYLGIFYISPGKYSLCIPVEDHAFFLSYQTWYDAHKRPRTPEAWIAGQITPSTGDPLGPPLPDYEYDDRPPRRVRRMIE